MSWSTKCAGAPRFFFLASTDSIELTEPRRCISRARLRGDVRDDWLLVSLEPALGGGPFGLPGEQIAEVILSARFLGDTLFPVSRWPVIVNVACLAVPYEDQEFVTDNQIHLLALGQIHETEEDARSDMMK